MVARVISRLPGLMNRPFSENVQQLKLTDQIMRNEGVIMKNLRNITIALLLCALPGPLALAKSKSHAISFDQDTMVNGTLVRKGKYRAAFDEKTEVFTLQKGQHVIITATVVEETLEKKAPSISFEVKTGDDGAALTKVTFEGK